MNVSSEIALWPMYFRSALQPAFRSAPQRMCLLYFFDAMTSNMKQLRAKWAGRKSKCFYSETLGWVRSRMEKGLKQLWPVGSRCYTSLQNLWIGQLANSAITVVIGNDVYKDWCWVFYMISFFSCLFLKYAPRKWQRSQQMSFSFLQLSILQLLLKSPIFLFLQSWSKADDFFVREVLDIDSHLLVSPLHLHLLELFVVSVKIVGYHSKGREK